MIALPVREAEDHRGGAVAVAGVLEVPVDLPPTMDGTGRVTGSNSYDEVPYENHAFAQSHPDRLATMARMFGLTSPSVAAAACWSWAVRAAAI